MAVSLMMRGLVSPVRWLRCRRALSRIERDHRVAADSPSRVPAALGPAPESRASTAVCQVAVKFMVRSRRPRGTRRARVRPPRWSRSRVRICWWCDRGAVVRARRSGGCGRADRLGGFGVSRRSGVRARVPGRLDEQAAGDPGDGLGDAAERDALAGLVQRRVNPSQEPSWRGERKRCQSPPSARACCERLDVPADHGPTGTPQRPSRPGSRSAGGSARDRRYDEGPRFRATSPSGGQVELSAAPICEWDRIDAWGCTLGGHERRRKGAILLWRRKKP